MSQQTSVPQSRPGPFSWKQYLDIADWLAENHPQDLSEAAHRAAISRAYYAAHWTVRVYAEKKLRFPKWFNGSVHLGLISHLAGSNDPDLLDIATNLEDLRKKRTYCDYRNPFPTNGNLPILSTTMRELAGEIIAWCNEASKK